MKVYKECCQNCLFSPDSIVSPKKRKEIIQSCIQEKTYFICHIATMRDEDVCCKTYYDTLGQYNQRLKIAQTLGMVEMIEQPKSAKLPTYREMSVRKKEV